MVLGNAPDFHVEALAYAGVETGPLYFLFGAVAGGAAVLYNRTLLGAISIANLLAQGRVELRAALIGASVGVLAWLAPDLVGGGDIENVGVFSRPRPPALGRAVRVAGSGSAGIAHEL